MNRRDFLATSALAAASATFAKAQKTPKGLDRLTVLSWSFRDAFANTRSKTAPWVPDKDLDIMDYPDMIADRYGIHKVEIQTMYLQPEASFRAELLKRIKKAKSKLVNIAGEPRGGVIEAVGGTDEKARANAVEVYKGWVDYAKDMECPNLMINQGNLYDDINPLIDSCKQLVAYGKTKNVGVSAEPRGSSGKNPEIFLKILQGSGMKATIDIGNFSDDARERGIRLLAPYAANTCHIKYNPDRFDYDKIMRLVLDCGYKGLFTIEASYKADQYAEVKMERDELLKYA